MNLGKVMLLISLIGSILTIIMNITINKNGNNKKIIETSLVITALSLSSSFMLILYYQFTCNFKYSYVVEHISIDLKPIYKISALWAGQSGSFLLWAVISIWLGFAIKSNRKAFNIYMIITTALIIFVYISNPFAMEKVIVLQGKGLNLALQNPWMAIHPPLVFIGYSAMAILFCQGFSNIVDKTWVFISLLFLGAGIFTGSIWAYNALGWGGYWAWDPIENAALVPWMVLIAITHRKKVKPYVSMIPFVLAVFGTFLARSGVLKGKSVHSYNVSTTSTPIIILISFLCLTLFVIFIQNKYKKIIINDNISLKNILSIFCIITYLFSIIILIGTTLPIFMNYSLDTSFYNVLAIIFALISSILFLLYINKLFEINIPIILLVNTFLVIILALITKVGQAQWLIMIWLLMLPFILKLIYFSKFKNIWANISHIGFMLIVLGSTVSSAFSEKGVFLETQPIGSDAMKTNIIHNFLGDIIITEGSKYTTKPFIYLFWIGGVLIMISFMGKIFSVNKIKSHS